MQDQGSANSRGSVNNENAITSGSTRTITIPGDIQIQTIERGTLRLHRIVLGNLPELLSLLNQEATPRVFTTRYISILLVSPKADEQAIAGWSDELLKRVAVQWLHAISDEKPLTETEGSSFEDIAMALRAQVKGQQEILDKAVVSMLKPVQQVAEVIQNRQNVLTEMTRAITATRFKYAIPRFDIGISSVLKSMNDMYGLTSARQFIESNRSAMDAAAQLQSPIASSVSGAIEKATLASSILNQMSSTIASAGALTSFTSAVNGLQSAITQIASSARVAQESVAAAFATALPKFSVGDIFPLLPDLTKLTPQLERARRAYTALDEGGFAFTEHLWNWSFLLSFAGAGTRVTGAAVTNRMLAHTRKPAFQQELQKTIEGSTVLRRRWRIVGAALAAHVRREYHVAIPLFLAQLEGMIGDALIIKGGVRKDGHKLIERLPNGGDKLDRNGDPVSIRGLDRLVRISPFANHDALQLASDLILNTVAKDRNGILHGRSTNYDKPKFSAQLILMIYAFAAEIAAFEAGLVQW